MDPMYEEMTLQYGAGSAAEREARRPDVVEVVASRLRHAYFTQLSPASSRKIAEDLLETVGEMLIGESALEHAEPVVEHAVEAAMHPPHPEAALAPPKTIARSTIASAMKAIRLPIPRSGQPADPIFDAFATAAERCDLGDYGYWVCAERRPPSISTDAGWTYWLVVQTNDVGPTVEKISTSDLEFRKSPFAVERAVEYICITLGHGCRYVGPTDAGGEMMLLEGMRR